MEVELTRRKKKKRWFRKGLNAWNSGKTLEVPQETEKEAGPARKHIKRLTRSQFYEVFQLNNKNQ